MILLCTTKQFYIIQQFYLSGGSGTQKFDIEKETGEIRRKEEVDRETVDKFDLVIKVSCHYLNEVSR